MALYDVSLAGGEAEKITFDNSVSGMNASDVQGAIDELAVDTVLPRYKRVGLNTIGWYRIAKLSCYTLDEALGSGGNDCEIEINRQYNKNNNEFKKIQMVSLMQNTSFCNEISKANNQIITKIRHTVDTVNFDDYIEVYYNTTNENLATFILSNYRNAYGTKWELIEPELTEETVEGITVLGSHEFSLNYDMQTQLGNSIKKTDVVNLAHHIPTTVSTDTVVVKTHTVTNKGLLCTSFIMFENSVGVTTMVIRVNGTAYASMAKTTDTPSISLCTIVNVGDVITWEVKASGSGTNNTLINGFILNLE